jgi:hypothetical protein
MTSTRIKLSFKGPIPFLSDQEKATWKERFTFSGVYLWCVQSDKTQRYSVYYVGKAFRKGGVAARLEEELHAIRNGKSTLFDVSQFKASDRLDIKHWAREESTASELQDKQPGLADKNLRNTWVFAAPCSSDNDAKNAESGLIITLSRDQENRGYLPTRPQKYPPRELVLEISFEEPGSLIQGIPPSTIKLYT